MKKPNLLIKNDLIQPIDQALDRIEKIRERKASSDDLIIFEGLFVLAVASFENSLNDTLKIFLKSFPYKLDGKVENITKEDLIEGNPLEKQIDSKIKGLSYKNLAEIMEFFCNTISINSDCISQDHFNSLLEVKATRNLLIHNNLVINEHYIEGAGPSSRSSRLGEKIKVEHDYLFKSITTLKYILEEFKKRILKKYEKYTYIRAFKTLWEFMLPTAIMRFETEWRVDESRDIVNSYNEESTWKNGLSDSERIIHNIWLSHFNGTGINTDYRNFYRLDEGNRKKIGYFLTVLDLVKAR